jgi:guanine deaminase
MLDVMDVFLRVHEGHTEVTACEAFWRATLAGARALGFAPRRGALLPGRSADFLVVNERLPRSPTPEDVLRELLRRGERGRWDALIAETWVGGRRCQPG